MASTPIDRTAQEPARQQTEAAVPPNGEATADDDGSKWTASDASAEAFEKYTTDDLPSTEPGSLEDLTRFVADDNVGLKQSLAVVCLVGPPGKMAVFRTSKDMSLYRDVFVLDVGAEGEKKTQYLVDPGLCVMPEFADRVKRKKLVPYITIHGVLGLWPISVDLDDNTWVRSATTIIVEAQDRWVSAIPQRAGGQYRMLPAEEAHDEPKWPAMTFFQWLDLAFPRDRRITNREHPVAKKLRG